MEPLVYIVLVNYQGYSDTVECVESILRISYKNYKIVVVDNASSDSESLRKDDFLNKNAKILYAVKNKGFSDGNNIGIKYAMQFSPKYILLLNNDTIVDPNFLSELVDSAEKNANAGIITGKIYYNSSGKLWYAGGEYYRRSGITKQVIYDDNVVSDKVISFASGCLMLISMDCFSRVGLLDDSYFLYSEDTDYCCRVVDSGLKILWNPRSIIYHKVSSSTGHNSAFQQYYLTRNNLFLASKYGKSMLFAYLCRVYQSVKDVIKRRANIKPLLWAYIDFSRGIREKGNRF